MARLNRVDITPGVSVLAVLRHLNYKPWFALAEFVDNSLESYIRCRDAILESDGSTLVVDIDVDGGSPPSISIRDNAAGIFEDEYGRAFRPAAIPPDRSGLAEFGMGMKSAACWFAPQWTVRTSALGEAVSRMVYFDIQNIVEDDIRELVITESAEHPTAHYTEVRLENVFHVPVRRTVGKIKEHLTDIYRGFIRDGVLELRFNGEALRYQDPEILVAKYYKDPGGPDRVWRKDIGFDFGNGMSVTGFAALRKTASTRRAGFSLFRRNRVIQGSGDECYRPRFIFGAPNRYRFQRLFGELHLTGFEVSHTKDGFRWDENEQPFLELLREHLDHEDLPLLRQAEGYRVRAPKDHVKRLARTALKGTARVMKDQLGEVLPAIQGAEPVETPTHHGPTEAALAERSFEVSFRDTEWLIQVEVTNDPAESQWVALSDAPPSNVSPRRVGIRVSVAHPFMVRFAQNDAEDLEGLLRTAAAICLAEICARDAGVRNAGTIRRNVNDILRYALSES